MLRDSVRTHRTSRCPALTKRTVCPRVPRQCHQSPLLPEDSCHDRSRRPAQGWPDPRRIMTSTAMCRTRAKTIQAPIRTTNRKPIRARSARRRPGVTSRECSSTGQFDPPGLKRRAAPRGVSAKRQQRVFQSQVNREKEKARRPRPPSPEEPRPSHRLADCPGWHRGGFRAGDDEIGLASTCRRFP